MSETPPVIVETGPEPIGSVIWLHGLGADGHDFEPVVPQFALPASLPLRFVFPHAPVRPVTINGGMAMRAWYDIVSLDAEGRADTAGIRDSIGILDGLVQEELARGLAPQQVVIAGFSQGGVIALHYALESASRFAGLLALSTYLALPVAQIGTAASAPGTGVPAFVGHGNMDPMVPCDGGRHAAATLESLGYRVEWHEYPMAHGVCPQEIDDIRRWLLAVYASDSSAPKRNPV